MKNNLRLNLGCGAKKNEGWVNVDCIKEFAPDLLHDISKPFPYSDESVEEILAMDILEHFDKYIRFIVFYEWIRMLKVKGIITIGVPNFHKIISRYFQFRMRFNFDSFFTRIFGETMRDSGKYIGHFGIHKWGYTEKTLKDFIQNFGLKPIKITKKHSSLVMVAHKYRHMQKSEFDQMLIYPMGRSKGFSISVKEVREKTEYFLEGNTVSN